MVQNTNNPNNPINTLTTEELVGQGYPEDVAARHPANANNIPPTSPDASGGVPLAGEPEMLPTITTTPKEAIGAAALAKEMLRADPSDKDRPVLDRRTGTTLTQRQFAELNSDPHTRL